MKEKTPRRKTKENASRKQQEGKERYVGMKEAKERKQCNQRTHTHTLIKNNETKE